MSIYELLGFSTDRRTEDIRWRSHTSSKRKADLFKKIPKIQFIDSGHGIVFCSRLMNPGERRKAENRYLAEYVHEELTKLGFYSKLNKPSSHEILEALTRLSNEVLGSLPLMEPLARREFGNSNYALLIQRAEEARALIIRAKGAQ